MARKLLIAVVLVAVLATVFMYIEMRLMMRWLTSAKDDGATTITMQIPEGSSVRQALKLLIEAHVVEDAPYLRLVGKIGPTVPGIQAGEYQFSSAQSPIDLLETMHKGKVKTYTFTIPEGYNVKEIGETLEKQRIGTAKELATLAGKSEFLKSLGIPYLEGYVFPDTYHIPKGLTLKQAVRMMVVNGRKQREGALMAKAQKKGLTEEKVLIMASIAEKESGSPAEYPIVASVIHNRLRKGMPLQMDPTVIYGIKNFDGNLTRKHLRMNHPWNTYVHGGLPPTPICNPGLGAIRAIVEPAQTNYLYFVSMNNGSHKFSSSLKEHNRAVQLYQVRGKVGP